MTKQPFPNGRWTTKPTTTVHTLCVGNVRYLEVKGDGFEYSMQFAHAGESVGECLARNIGEKEQQIAKAERFVARLKGVTL